MKQQVSGVKQEDAMNLDDTYEMQGVQYDQRLRENLDILEQISAAHQSEFGDFQVPKFCSLHGKRLEYFCFQCKTKTCDECVRRQHKNHKFNYVNVCANINKEVLDFLLQKTGQLQLKRKKMHHQILRSHKGIIRDQVLEMKAQSMAAIEEAS